VGQRLAAQEAWRRPAARRRQGATSLEFRQHFAKFRKRLGTLVGFLQQAVQHGRGKLPENIADISKRISGTDAPTFNGVCPEWPWVANVSECQMVTSGRSSCRTRAPHARARARQGWPRPCARATLTAAPCPAAQEFMQISVPLVMLAAAKGMAASLG
jgi:hypothetical protein